MKNIKYISLFLTSVLILCLALTGCLNSDNKADDTTAVTTAQEETAKADETTDLTKEDHPSLVSFRQGMTGTTQIFGAAYLGYTLDMLPQSFEEFVTTSNFTLYNDLPFIPAIPENRIVGNGMGEVYCIVPLDENAKISISIKSASDVSDAFDNEIYSSDKGDPIILFCNAGCDYPDTQVTIANSSGNSVTWYPRLDSSGKMQTENGTCSAQVINDFTPYTQLRRNEYSDMKDTYWVLPTKEQLIGSSWTCEELRDDGSVHFYDISFSDNTVSISWNNDGEDHQYTDAPWSLSFDEGVATLIFDFENFAGEQRCSVLVGNDGGMLYTCADLIFGDDDLCDSGVSSRILERSVG